jgi:hypothetical protein
MNDREQQQPQSRRRENMAKFLFHLAFPIMNSSYNKSTFLAVSWGQFDWHLLGPVVYFIWTKWKWKNCGFGKKQFPSICFFFFLIPSFKKKCAFPCGQI